MTASRPYLLRALHEWVLDNGMTPHVLIDATVDGVEVPERTVQNGKVVLNIAPQAVKDLEIGNDYLSFVARFSGVTSGIVIPIGAILAVYARESGQGMMFPQEDSAVAPADGPDVPAGKKAGKKGRGHLKVIK